MRGRDPHEEHRVSTPLELLYDLTFVVAIGLCAEHFAEFIVEHHVGAALTGFLFGMFSILNAWIGFSWFSSAFDTDDALYRVLTMVQMVGVVVLALGMDPMFDSLVHTEHGFDLRLIAVGYVIMRVALVGLWWRVVRDSDEYDVVAKREIALIVTAQVLWVVVAFVRLPVNGWMLIIPPLAVGEVLIPMVAQRDAGGTPWHGHHIAERYGLLAIIGLGEGVVGSVATGSSLVAGWDFVSVLLVVIGIGLTFSMWWVYFRVPFGDLLHHRRHQGFWFGYGHLPIFMAIAATGAGLHVAALSHSGEHHVGTTTVVLCIAVPVAVFLVTLWALTRWLSEVR